MEALFDEYEEINKSGLFDAKYYLSAYPDIARRGIDPLVHYLEEGGRQGRNPYPGFDAAFYLEQCLQRGEMPGNPLLHYLRVGHARGFAITRPSGYRGAAISANMAPRILVAIESLDAAVGADGSRKVSLTGWALAPAPIAEITVSIGGRIAGTAAYGLARPDIERLYPDLPEAARCGMTLAFELPAAAPAAIEPLLTVRTASGETGVHRLRLAVPPQHPAGGPIEPLALGDPDHKLHLDAPLLIGGAMATPVRADLEIAGWALARAGVATIEIAVDGARLMLADYGLRRLDLHRALPDWDGALASGYRALVPQRVLPKGRHAISVTLRDKTGGTSRIAFGIEVEELGDRPGPWSLRRRMRPAEVDLYRPVLSAPRAPRFVAVLPLSGRDAVKCAAVTLGSLRAQVYPHWRLLVVAPDLARAQAPREALLGAEAAADGRIALIDAATASTIAGVASGDGIGAAETFVSMLTPGDELGVDALLEMTIAAAHCGEADFLYSDERRPDPGAGAIAAYFKPQWSPDLLLSANYIGRLWCVRGDLLRSVADPAELLPSRGEYDLVLRCTERAQMIRHVPAVLCERGKQALDPPRQEKAALRRALVRRGIAGEVRAGLAPGTWQVSRAIAKPGLVSIVIPTCAARSLIETCITSLRRLTAYRDYEIVCIENIADADRKWRTWLRRHADRVVAAREPFNWARFSNVAAAEAKGDYLLFLNDDIEVIDADWLQALVEHAQRPEVGAVGARLLYPDRRIQHAGMFLAAVGQARHAFRYADPDEPGYFGLAATTRNVIAVTGACLMTRRDLFEALRGFDETQSIVNNDLDYCLRVRERGLLTIYTPHATLVHHEAVSRAALDDAYDAAGFAEKWRELFLAGDPYFSRHLSKSRDDFAADDEPTQLLVTGGPVLRRAAVRRILAVKLDHIGDCVIAFPALRRLRQLFPEARITVLTSHASRPIWSQEPNVDDTIAFDFFHPRSGLGEISHPEEDWAELRQRLSAERFDLAVDLRKHTETRPVLRHTGAAVLAGFDFRSQFPWLDIALEWTGDQIYAKKRQHNGDDLVNLVDAIAAACDGERTAIAAPQPTAPPMAIAPPRAANGPLVCVHPTVGNDARQWPVEYFVAVIDRLVAADGAQVVLIGAPGDESVADGILAGVRDPRAVTSVVGKLPLAELPSFLAGVSLFLGNNSGPKHIAAGLGVATVGVHSGTEDVREWGPVGSAAVAVARDMVCSPCYLAHASDCHRGLACLRELEPARVYEACKRMLLLNPAETRTAAVETAVAAEG